VTPGVCHQLASPEALHIQRSVMSGDSGVEILLSSTNSVSADPYSACRCPLSQAVLMMFSCKKDLASCHVPSLTVCFCVSFCVSVSVFLHSIFSAIFAGRVQHDLGVNVQLGQMCDQCPRDGVPMEGQLLTRDFLVQDD
jgi:hypothetical protein